MPCPKAIFMVSVVLVILWTPAVMAADSSSCKEGAAVAESMVKARDAGVARSVVEAAIVSGNDISLAAKLGQLRAVAAFYSTPSITPAAAHESFRAQCKGG